MNAIEFYSYKVPEFRAFLQERGVNGSLCKQIELVRLCKLAVELDLEIIAKYDVNDYKVMDLKRKKVEVNGVNVVIPSPTKVKTFEQHLGNLSDIHTCDILIFLMIYYKWDNQILQTYNMTTVFDCSICKSH